MLTFDDGVHLIGTELFLDARRGKPRGIVSHAHADHVARHQRWVASPGTAALCARRWAAEDLELHGFHAPWREGETTVTLLPAGHILGSSMVLLEHEGVRILYTGDFRLKPSVTAEACEPVAADILVMECTFGDPVYRFPERERLLDRLCDWIDVARGMDTTPVLLAYSLGKAQEAARLLGDRGYPVAMHASAHDLLDVYRDQGVQFGDCEPYDLSPPGERVVIVPPHLARTRWIRGLPRRQVAFLSGWALQPRRTFWPRCDAAFPLSDHADFDELLEMVERVQPRLVYTLHGPDAFASELRRRGIDAEPARFAAQMRLFH
jgi:Cft2 family RNA processing exonuclease